MIRPFKTTDTDAVIKIWLDASIIAHDFVNADYWRSKADDMRNIYLPSATTHVYEDSGKITGFISMVENYVAAIFVSPELQGKGIGKQLIDFVKQKHETLELAVYKENVKSAVFYEKQGFQIVREGIEEHTGHAELIMKFEKFHIRKATVSDIPEMNELYKNTILSVNRKDYSAEEVEDWASCVNDMANLHNSFSEQYYIVAENDHAEIVGFASINDAGYMHTMFVHKDFQHHGIATLLYKTLEEYARSKGAKKITSEISITAKPFFEKQGFVVDEVQKRKANKLCLTNYKMSKDLSRK